MFDLSFQGLNAALPSYQPNLSSATCIGLDEPCRRLFEETCKCSAKCAGVGDDNTALGFGMIWFGLMAAFWFYMWWRGRRGQK